MRLRLRSFLFLLLSGLIVSCSFWVPAASPDQEGNLGQTLPISAQVEIANQVIELEVARTPAEQAMGLMYRESLPDNRGMLFIFNPPRPVGFWMKNVRFPLDMVFLRNQKIIQIASEVPPCEAKPCPIYSPPGVVDQVIELRGGRAKELQLKQGDRVEVELRS
ncbi:MAG TPA: DUF192 domain-containing protein [Leptolyngbyaceae cyanobacterium M33_DOE_097]|uniref:DUF192 domain-containing protein n=1 Tax=Oscillatoriales cyanobacterium SpSt-418 TaxID=2282169 RepID=A0A7C3PH72_9CYAN|nr:DUF192 domain-containing protein [Leptolyngbyaceae cyanobacterium M33_DOE_097]